MSLPPGPTDTNTIPLRRTNSKCPLQGPEHYRHALNIPECIFVFNEIVENWRIQSTYIAQGRMKEQGIEIVHVENSN